MSEFAMVDGFDLLDLRWWMENNGGEAESHLCDANGVVRFSLATDLGFFVMEQFWVLCVGSVQN